MRHLGALAGIFGFFALSCGIAVAHPSGFSNHRFNPPDQQPVTEAGITTFHIEHGLCSDVDYGDGRGENDCKNGNVRSVLSFERQARMGEAIEYRLDIQLDASFAYEGWANAMAEGLLPGGWDSDLRIATWEGEFLHNFIYRISADSRKGIAFLGRTCQTPADFGKWVSFSMAIKWSSAPDGWIRVTCDDRLIYARENIATNVAPHCYLANQCEPGIEKDPRRIHYVIGPVMQGAGDDWQETGRDGFFTPIQEGGITIRMRNVEVKSGAERYRAADTEIISDLQTTLNALGCDVGAVDGIAGRRTQEAVFTCRVLDPGEAPLEWNLETAPLFLDLYTRPGVAGLPRPDGPVQPPLAIRAWESFSRFEGDAPQITTDIDAEVTRADGSTFTVRFILIGRYSLEKVAQLEMLFQQDIGAAAAGGLASCPDQRVESWDDGTHHLVLRFAPGEAGFVHRESQCLIDALPEAVGGEIAFVLDHFRDIALAMTRSGTVEDVKHNGVREMIRRVASGDLMVARR